MMKRLFILGLVVALVAVLVLPMATMASSSTSVSGHVLASPTVNDVYLTSTTTPASGSPTASSSSGPIIVDIIGTNFDYPLGADPTPLVATSAGSNITITSVSVVSTTKITATFTVLAATTSGNYDVTVTQGGRTSATSSADYFLVHSYGTVTAPSAISLGLMSVGSTATGNDVSTGSISTNDAIWNMTVQDTKATNPGFMSINGDGTGGTLTNAFEISKDSTLGDFVSANTGLSSGTTYVNSGTSLPIYVSQQVVSGDAAGSYSITITFTYSAKY
jgi:hypothetical protein